MASYERLQNLCEAAGVSGQEDEVREKILAMIRPVCDTVTVTPLGGILWYQIPPNGVTVTVSQTGRIIARIFSRTSSS